MTQIAFAGVGVDFGASAGEGDSGDEKAPSQTGAHGSRHIHPSRCARACARRRAARLSLFRVGENGSGKSTLLEGIAVAFGLNPEGGTKHERFTTQSTHSRLFRSLILTKSRDAPTDSYFLRAESFYNVASAMDPRDVDQYGGRVLHAQSHGESFLSLVLHRLRGNGLYLFDEPEAALSPARQLALLAAMHRLVQRNSQFIIATHSPILLGFPAATIYLFAEKELSQIAYLDTEHYQITKAFLDRPERMLNELFRADEPSDT